MTTTVVDPTVAQRNPPCSPRSANAAVRGPHPDGGETFPEPWPVSIPLVAAADDVCHRTDADVHGAELADRREYFSVLCGRSVRAASLLTPIGPLWCEPCRTEARCRLQANEALRAPRRNRCWSSRIVRQLRTRGDR
ncbi:MULTISPECIES: hypothetical protein [unclassified Pseudonocardia]|uniref:hypothetical protein n=1 Tax=unclassified Pseudonocardia TaxID=2619320 RepID=UPI0001FFED1F|nr:hypothetical protein [Pseudonocardia sp. Ae707_Ps1]OLM16992.1 hypothetical protein Ae707Ps1_1251 [Pseudonocardia sp. Ae707_Ps1]